jgi:hypothetical protein
MNNKVNLLDIDFHFGIGFLSALLEGTKLNLTELGTQADEVLLPKIMYYSRAYAMQRADLSVDFNMSDIFDLVDNNGGIAGEFWNSFSVAFSNSMSKDVPVQEGKKKVTKK